MKSFDVAVIGAGPSGMAASNEVAKAGLSVALLDEHPRLGGQTHRVSPETPAPTPGFSESEYRAAIARPELKLHQNVTYFPKARMWSFDQGEIVFASGNGAESLFAKRVLLATGSIERPMPIPGWTLPGVMTAGAAQIFSKHAGCAENNTVLIGSGPYLIATAVNLLRAGYPPAALIETQTRKDLRKSLSYGFAALSGRRHLQRNLAMATELRNANVKRFIGAKNISLLGDHVVESVHFRMGRRLIELPADTVFLHHGLIPEGHAAGLLGVPHHWEAQQNAYIAEHNV